MKNINSLKKGLLLIVSLFVCIFFIGNNYVLAAETFNSKLSVSTTSVQPGDTFTVTLSLSNLPSSGIGAITYAINYNSDLVEYVSHSSSQFSQINVPTAGTLKLAFLDMTSTNPLTSGVELTFKAKADGNVSFSLNANGISDLNGNTLNSNNTGASITIRTKSNENRLRSLTVDGFTDFVFNRDTLNYSISTEKSSVTVRVTPALYGSITSNGGAEVFTKELKYGENIIQIHSNSESGLKKIYTIVVTRIDTRDKDATLSSIEGINNFDKNKYTYDVTIPTNQGVFNVVAKATMTTSKIEYSRNTVLSLDYGETKSINITVTAENGNKITYTLNVTRKDDRDGNSYLKSLSVNPGSMNFNKENYSYRIVVDNEINEVTIGATAESTKTLVDGIGKKPLAIGSNLFRVTATAENGTQKIYTITIIRKDKTNDASKLSRNTKVTSLRLNGEEIYLRDNIYAYAVSVENDVSLADFVCDLEDPKAMALLEGDRNLKVGVNKFKITVTAENGDSIVYDIIVERQELRKLVQNTKADILNTIRNSSEAVITVTVAHDDYNRTVDTEILSALKSTGKTIIYEVLNKNNGLNYSFTINASDITEIAEFDFNLTFTSENKDAIDLLSNAKKTVYVDLKNSNIKGKMTFKVYVGETFDATNTLTLYSYDKDTNTLNEVKDGLKVKNNYVEVELDKFSEYILMDKSLVNSNSNLSGGSLASIGIIALVVIIIIIIIIIIKKKR